MKLIGCKYKCNYSVAQIFFDFFDLGFIMVMIFNSKKMLNYEGETYSREDFGFLLP
jgi:hypothetical protein